MTFFGCSTITCVSMNNQEWKIRPEIITMSHKSSFYLYSFLINKCSRICNNINELCAKLCAPDVAKSINIKVFNLMPRTNKARYKEWHEPVKCKCKLDTNVCKNK